MTKNLIYSITCLVFTIIIGAAVYEHVAVVPQWTAAPPVSLTMFQGKYGLNPAMFWKTIHPVAVLLFLITLAVHRKSDRKRPLVTVLISYIAILVVTAIYFVPELLRITSAPLASTVDPDLVKRAALWETLSLARLGVLVILSLVLFNGLTTSNDNATAAKPIFQPAQPTPA